LGNQKEIQYMARKWHQKATVQAAMVAGVVGLFGVLISTFSSRAKITVNAPIQNQQVPNPKIILSDDGRNLTIDNSSEPRAIDFIFYCDLLVNKNQLSGKESGLRLTRGELKAVGIYKTGLDIRGTLDRGQVPYELKGGDGRFRRCILRIRVKYKHFLTRALDSQEKFFIVFDGENRPIFQREVLEPSSDFFTR
jgi:hypothetical protein